ncbi:MAG: four-carbon acid sugar kinase family protein [Thermodesulfobacteriota bacterium]
MFEFAIIADDLTGSLDTGLQFRKKGFTTLVPLPEKKIDREAEVLVINTNSRNLPGRVAYQKVYRVARGLNTKGIYKKIDSTMRGNVGLEALAILRAKKIPKAIVTPSIPSQGRQVEKGVLYVHGVPLLKTPYARDPFHPLHSSRLPQLLHKETGLLVGLISLKQVRKSPRFLAEAIMHRKEQILVVEAKEQDDLKNIASAWHLISEKILPCGSVGLAQEIASLLEIKKEKKKKKYSFSKGPFLIVSASRNPITAKQLKKAQEIFNFSLIEPDLGPRPQKRWIKAEQESLLRKIKEGLTRYGGAILTTTFLEHLPGKEKLISNFLGEVTALLLCQMQLGGLILTGGDLAMGVCALLSASFLSIEEEVLPGIPFSILRDGPNRGLRLVTKAGGFGEEDALEQIIKFLRRKNEERF